jgi:hypothetical protein
MHDLYPDVLVMAGILKPSSIPAKAMRAANGLIFRALDADVIIGRDTEPLLLCHGGLARDKIRFIPKDEGVYAGRVFENRNIVSATPRPPVIISMTSIPADWVRVEAIASTARPTLSANTSLTTRNTENPLSVAR